MTYQCDECGRHCSRPHRLQAYGMDCLVCDECADYDWEAYDEEPDPLLVDRRPRSVVPWTMPSDGNESDEPPF
jgi:ribosome-binding protein aMBF1 (putative translation factor)